MRTDRLVLAIPAPAPPLLIKPLSQMSNYGVVIVGGGVFGLSAAFALAQGMYRLTPERVLVIGDAPATHLMTTDSAP